ncbi:MAG: hypothetical protein HKN47_21220, partial [Pirellulaceae bacterium]|nr:hypothetical protein [Pirellulaceae bacterium]
FSVPSPAGLSSTYERPAVVTDDGLVVQVQPDFNAALFRAMVTINGGEQITENRDQWKLISDGRERAEKKP